MVPSVTSTPLHAINSQRRFIYTCADANQQPLDCSIGISNRAVALSGGHQHQISPRPAGSLTATSGNTNFNTGFSTTYTAPEVSGTIELLVTLVFPPVPPATTGQTVSFTQTIGVEITGLETLPSGNWTPKGMVAGQHTDNHYGLPSMNASVLLLADDYRFEFGVPLEINDMSLVQGGLFDVFGPNAAREWHTDHKSHRWGDDVDVNLPPRSNRSSLLRSAGYVGLRRIVEPGRLTHYHFRLK
jgi:hypothetical protein